MADLEEEAAMMVPELKSVKGLARDDVRKELVQRGIQPVGMPQEDLQRLKEVFEEEYGEEKERYEEMMRKKAEEIRAEEERLRQERTKLAAQREERALLKSDPKLRLFIELMKESRTSREACFSGPPAMGRAIGKALPICQSLVSLDLSGGSLGDNGTIAIAHALADPATTLKRLDLDSNLVGPAGVHDLGEALTINQSLVALSLENNNLSGDYQDYSGLRALGSALTSNSQLKSLNLNRTMLGVNGLSLFAAAMHSNSSIVMLDADYNGNVKQSDVNKLLKRLQDNKDILKEREEIEMQEQAKRLRLMKLQAAENAKRIQEEKESKEADERARLRHEERLREYEEAKEAKRVFLEEAHARAHERQAEFEETEGKKKGKGKKKK